MEIVRKNKIFLIDTLSTDFNIVLHQVRKNRIITEEESVELKDLYTEEMIISNLLDIVMSKGDEACQNFLKLLEKEDLQKIFPQLKEISRHDVLSQGQHATTSDEIQEYKMSSKTRGVCLIIINMTFDSSHMNLNASIEEEEELLKDVFRWLGFSVVVFRNQTAEQMKSTMKEYSEMQHEGDCFMCWILSHCTTGGFYGSDKGIITVDEIFNPFSEASCPSLIHKPKVFFILDCCGTLFLPTDTTDKKQTFQSESDQIRIPDDFLVVNLTGERDRYWNPVRSRFIRIFRDCLRVYCPLGQDLNSILLKNRQRTNITIRNKLRKKLVFHMLKPEDSPGTSARWRKPSIDRIMKRFGVSFYEVSSSSTHNPETEHCSFQELSAHTEVFTPELDEHHHEDWIFVYRFACSRPGQFQCKYTDLVFEMKEEAEVLYSIVSWGSIQLDCMGEMQPAGPLYNIDCFEGAICKLHLPHCEIRSDETQTELVVGHFSDGNLEIIQPLEVTDTHVILEIKHLSLIALLMKIIFNHKPVKAQVLLFYKEIIGNKIRRRKLHMHLLPRNVPIKEVHNQHKDNVYIESSSDCDLIPGKKYKPHCDHYKWQPKIKKFERDFGPNYHPTFEVLLNAQTEDLTLGLLDKDDEEAWESRQIFLTENNREAVSPKPAERGWAFVDKHRESLIQKVSSVMEIADGLLSKQMITDEMYKTISTAATPQEKMRILYGSLDSTAAKEECYRILKKKQPNLVDDLESGDK